MYLSVLKCRCILAIWPRGYTLIQLAPRNLRMIKNLIKIHKSCCWYWISSSCSDPLDLIMILFSQIRILTRPFLPKTFIADSSLCKNQFSDSELRRTASFLPLLLLSTFAQDNIDVVLLYPWVSSSVYHVIILHKKLIKGFNISFF